MLSNIGKSVFTTVMLSSMVLLCRTDKCKATSQEVWLDSMETSAPRLLLQMVIGHWKRSLFLRIP